jgi:hypothetical protein
MTVVVGEMWERIAVLVVGKMWEKMARLRDKEDMEKKQAALEAKLEHLLGQA